MDLKTELFKAAKEAREKSYSPYSKFKVGSAIKFKESSEIFKGCNIENASFGGTICAERIAILKGISDLGKLTLEAIMVVTDSPEGDPPCGLCLQTMSEFSDESTMVYLANCSEIKQEFTQKQLLPNSFILSK